MPNKVHPSSVCVITPFMSHVDFQTELALYELARRGYHLKKSIGGSDIAMARSLLATDCLKYNYEYLFWIDSDIVFEPDAFEQVLNYKLPICCGVYTKKSVNGWAAAFLPTTNMKFGQGGGLHEIKYAGFGFMCTHRSVYETMKLPEVNKTCDKPFVPYFLPQIIDTPDGQIYLAEDYSFLENARKLNYKVMCDTRVKLYHVGRFGWSWDSIAQNSQQQFFNPKVGDI